MQADSTEADELLTVAEVAKRLRVTEATVRAHCRNKKWPHTKIGSLYRFTTEHYNAIIAPPVVNAQPRTQRKRIDRLLKAL